MRAERADGKEVRITGVVLAGGRGRRMGGVDKGLQLLHGRPLVQWVIERIAPQVDELLINVNRNVELYRGFGHPLIADRLPDFSGPLAGLDAALARADHPLVATVPCDSPFLPADLIARLHAGLLAEDAEIAVARTGGQTHPVFCLCRRQVMPHLAAYLAGGERRFERWYASLKVATVGFDDEADAFRNINTADDLARCSLS